MRRRQKFLCRVILFLPFTSAFAYQGVREPLSMFGGNPQLSGVYDAEPVTALKGVKFTFRTDGPLRGTPALADGAVFFGSGDGIFYCIDATSGAQRWRFQTHGAVHSSPAVREGRVYFASRDGFVYALSTVNGKQLWKFALGKDLGEQNYWDYYLSSPSLFGSDLYIGGGDGNLYAIDASSGRTTWKFDARSRIRSTPAVTDAAVVFGTMSGHVYAISRNTGRLLWKFATQGASNTFDTQGNDTTSIFNSASIGDGTVIIGGRDAYLYGIDFATGQQKWRITHDGSSWIAPTAIEDGQVYVGSGSAQIVQAADLQTGKERWRYKTGGAVFSSPTLVGGFLYFTDLTGTLHALDRASGAERWRFVMGQRSLSAPIVANGMVYCSSDDGVLYALEGEAPRASGAARARRIVFWQGKKTDEAFSWFQNGIDLGLLHYFKAAGYDQLDAGQLAEFMTQESRGHAHSVVVFSDNIIPASVAQVSSDQALIRRYLDAGGKVVLLGPNPLAYRADERTGVVEKVDFDVPRMVFGVPYPDPRLVNGYYGASVTNDGERWGLHGFVVGNGSVDASAIDVVLARDEYGKASMWTKRYGGPEGTGLLQLAVPRAAPTDLAPFQRAAEHGLD